MLNYGWSIISSLVEDNSKESHRTEFVSSSVVTLFKTSCQVKAGLNQTLNLTRKSSQSPSYALPTLSTLSSLKASDSLIATLGTMSSLRTQEHKARCKWFLYKLVHSNGYFSVDL